MSAPASLLSAGSQWPLTEAAQGLAGSGAHTVPGREPEVGETVSYGSVKQSGHTDEDRQDVGQGREKAGAPQLQPPGPGRSEGSGGGQRQRERTHVLEGSVCDILGVKG